MTDSLGQFVNDKLESVEIADNSPTSDKPYIISVSGTDIKLQDYIESENNYRVISIALSQRDLETYEAHTAIEQSLSNVIDIERKQHREQMINADTASDAKYNELYEQFHDLKNAKEDFERRFQAATSEIESLKQQLEATVKVEAQLPTNLNGNLAEAMRKAHEAKPAIYNVVEINGIKSTAISVDTNETIEFHPNYIGKYRVISHEEAMQMRTELEAAVSDVPGDDEPVESDLVVENKPTITIPNLPSEVSDAQPTNGLDEDSTGGQDVSDGSGGTVETFEQAVERRLAVLEAHAFGELQKAS